MIKFGVKTNPLAFLALCLMGVILPLFFSANAWSATASVKLEHSRESYSPGGTYPLVFQVQIQFPWFLHGPEKSKENPFPTQFHFSTSPGISIKDVQFPPTTEKKFSFTDKTIAVYAGKMTVRANLVVEQDAPNGNQAIEGQLLFQACSVSACLPPETVSFSFPLTVAGGVNKPLNPPEILKAAEPIPVTEQTAEGWQTGAGLWLTLLGIFLGGLALNLTPCIYPLIPITVSYFGGQGKKMGGLPLVHGIFYILGLAITNSILGVTAALSGGMLGTALQSPIVLFVVAAILIALAFSFFGFWELRIPAGLTNMAAKILAGISALFSWG